MEMPRVLSCKVKECSYNSQSRCHAQAINVGGPDGPFCDTSVKSTIKCGCVGSGGMVGACKVRACSFNDCLSCVAEGIKVDLNDGKPRCNTFKARE